MKFTTPVPIKPREPGIDYHSRIFLAGSCFVENIGEKFEYFKFQNLRNPFGILYHPGAIFNFIDRALSGKNFSEEDVFQYNERWHSFEAHSSQSHADKDRLLENLNAGLLETATFLREASHLIITPGTSWIYRRKDSGKIVANCHKLPQANFSKEILSVQEVKGHLEKTIEIIRSVNKEVQIIFTISPVRHIRDGVIENQRSKATLIAALHEVLEELPANVSYFPSFEIMMDELRDYRFYAEDMLHPNSVAVDYIWQQFVSTWFTAEAVAMMEKVSRIQKGLSHRPFNENSDAHQKFLANLGREIAELQRQSPYIKFSAH